MFFWLLLVIGVMVVMGVICSGRAPRKNEKMAQPTKTPTKKTQNAQMILTPGSSQILRDAKEKARKEIQQRVKNRSDELRKRGRLRIS